MDRGNFRSLLNTLSPARLSRTPAAPGSASHTPSFLLRAVGRALGLGNARAGIGHAEGLEQRAMLDGTFDSPIADLAINAAGQASFAGSINPAVPATNKDYYSFTATSSDFVSILADTANEAPASTLDTRVTVYDASTRTIVATGANNGTLSRGLAKDGWVGFVAQAGRRYFVEVSSEGTAQGTYTLRIDARSTGFEVGETLQSLLGLTGVGADDLFGASVAVSGNTAVVGAPGHDVDGNVDQGSVFVFGRTGLDWTLQSRLNAADGAANDFFGQSVAIEGDTLIVGSTLDDVVTIDGTNDDQGSAYVFIRAGASWTQQARLVVATGAASDRFGASVAISGETVVVGANQDDVGLNVNQGSAYVFTRTGVTWTLQSQLNAATGAGGDQFGVSVAISGNTVVVGAHFDDLGANANQGSAFVFTRDGTIWTQQAAINAADGAADDQFGIAVAISGDTVVVGANQDDVGSNADQGSAYVFTRSGTTWSQQARLNATGGATNDRFGVSVAIAGDTVIVGALAADVNASTDQGSAYVFVRGGATWTEQARLNAADGAAGDGFGGSVAIDGNTAFVGATLDDVGSNANQGSTYVFNRGGTAWSQITRLAATLADGGDQFGVSVSVDGDTAVVGAPGHDVNGNLDQGSVYVFIRAGSGWVLQSRLNAADGAAGDFFGQSVAIDGDTVIVGAGRDDVGANGDQGSAYVFVRAGATWTQQARLNAADGAADDQFGLSVAIAGNTVIVGAQFDDVGANADQGSAYVFTRAGVAWTQQARLSAAAGSADDRFGVSVAIAGDTAVVGAFLDDVGAGNVADQGSAHVFTRAGVAWTQQATLNATDGAAGDQFGVSVAIAGGTVVVGANLDDVGANTDQGSVYVFAGGGATWIQQARLNANGGAANDRFGASVAISGNSVAVGAADDDVGSLPDQGSAYVFVQTGATWTQVAQLNATEEAANDKFGSSVSIDGGTLIVGALLDDVRGIVDRGSASVFTRLDPGGRWTVQDSGIGRELGSPVPNPNAAPPVPLTAIAGQLTLRQQDIVYRFVAPPTIAYDSLVTVNAQSTQIANLLRRLDTRLDIYDAKGSPVANAFDGDAGRINDAFTTFKARPGDTFFIRVRSDEIVNANINLATGPFFLVLDAVATETPLNQVTRVFAGAGAFTGFGAPSVPPVPAVPNPVFQTDSYRFRSRGAGLTIITVQPTGLAPVTDPAVRLYDASGTLIAFNDNFVGASSQLEVQLDADRTYYIVVDGFETSSQVQYTIAIESNHTFDGSADTTNDDHESNPNFSGARPMTVADRRQFEKATMLTWNQARLPLDGNNNPLRDRGYVADAFGTGRIHGSGDTDLFQFIPQVDMLHEYGGDNNDNGTSLFIGGRFNTADPNTAHPVTSRGLVTWDAQDYWHVGAQFADAAAGVTYGFQDNPATLTTAGPEIYAFFDWDPNPNSNPPAGLSDRILMIGGDFDLVVPGPFGPLFFRNLIGWAQDPASGQWGFVDAVGSANGPVRAFAVFDPIGFDPDGSGPAAELPDPGGPFLVAGGDFTDIGGTSDGAAYTPGTAANLLASFDAAAGAWTNRGAGLVGGNVRALTTYDPPDPGAGRAASVGPPILTEVADAYNPPISLIIGGSFTGGITTWDGRAALTPLAYNSPSRPAQPATVNGVVNALAVMVDNDPDGEAGPDEEQEVLVIAGRFTNAGPLAGVGNIVKFGRPNSAPATSDPELPAYDPFIRWDRLQEGGVGTAGGTNAGEIHALRLWDPADINNTERAPILVIGGDFDTAENAPVGNLVAYGNLDPESLAPGAVLPLFFGPGALNTNGRQGIVRSLATIVGGDDEEPSIASNLRTGNPQDPLYLGGDFTQLQFNQQPAPVTARGVGQLSAFPGAAADFFAFSALAGGAATSVDASTPSVQALIDPQGGAGDSLGASISIYGDTMAVGAPNKTVGGRVAQGSVSIYSRISGQWRLEATITASDGVAGDNFGSSVSLHGGTLIVGASGDDVADAADRGSAYVFTRVGSAWVQTQRLFAADGVAGDAFGSSIAIFGASVIIGAPLDDVGANADQGSAYVFLQAAGAWTQQAKLNGTGGAAQDRFGGSVDIFADTVVVGVELDDVGAAADRGSAFVFTRAGGAWTQRAQILATGGAAGDRFGRSVSIWNDAIVVGAPGANVGPNADQGAGFVFTGGGAVWAQSARLDSADGAAGDELGGSVSIWGSTIAVGAARADVGGRVDQGAVYTFNRGGVQLAKQVDAAGAAGDRFGVSVAISEGTVVGGADARTVGGNAGQGQALAFNGTATVHALSPFDDGNPFAWDRHDRRATRVQIVLQPETGAFLNTFVRVYDSNLNLVYGFDRPGSNTINPPFQDPAGMIDQSLAAPQADRTLEGIKVWGGQTYYIEVSAGPDGPNGTPAFGLGRYSLQVTADALALDVPIAPATQGDGVPDEINAAWVPEPAAGAFASAIKITPALGNGDGTNIVDSDTPPPPLRGNSFRAQKINPSLGAGYTLAFDNGIISTLTDADLYYFRAEFTGTAELRLATLGIPDSFGELIGNDFRGDRTTYSSPLDGAIRAFDNDFQQLAYNNDSPGIVGESLAFATGSINAAYRRTDPRVVINVESGKQYFIQVESGQRYRVGAPADPAARIDNLAREVNWATATGSYVLVVNAMPRLDQDIENGVSVTDDHADAPANAAQLADFAPLGTVVAISNAGQGSASGVINNTPIKPADSDLMRFIAPGFGVMTVTLTATDPAFKPSLRLFTFNRATNAYVLVGDGLASSNLTQSVVTTAQTGQEFFLRVEGLTGTDGVRTEGSYQVSVSGIPFLDDHADFGRWAGATDIKLFDFLGDNGAQGTTGSIEVAGDSDVFRFEAITFQQITATVTALDASLTPAIFLYEVSEDPAGNPVFLRIGNGPNGGGGTSVVFRSPVSTERTIDVTPIGPGVEDRTYPYYYVVVRGQSPDVGSGRYRVDLDFSPTDDHADGSTKVPFVAPPGTVYDNVERSFASVVDVDFISGNGEKAGVIEKSTDTDLFKFTAPANGEATITISRRNASILRPMLTVVEMPTDPDANVAIILDSVGLPAQVFGEDNAFFPNASVTINVTRGQTYFFIVQGFEDLAVRNVESSILGEYLVTISASPIDDYPNVGEFALSDTQGVIAVSPITGKGELGGTTAGDSTNPRISPSGDTDLFNFTARNAGTYSITINPFNSAVGRLAPRITLLSATGVQLDQVTASAPLQSVTINITGVAANTKFYLLVAANLPLVFPPAAPTGEYNIRINGPAAEVGTDPSDIDFSTPTNVALNPRNGESCLNDRIDVVGDRDLFKFRTLGAGKVYLQLLTPQGSLLNASLSVHNAANETIASRVAFDSDGIAGVVATVSFDAPASTDYWVIVDGLGNSTGTYQLCVKAAPTRYQLYFPEGFASTQTREFVSIVNTNAASVNYTVYLRYETSDVQTVISNSVIAPGARGGVTIVEGSLYLSPDVRRNEPYAVIIESDQPLGATMAHYDFGSSIGDSFTDRLSPQWSFARAERDNGRVLDFIVFYNPGNFPIDVTLTAFQNDKPAVSVTRNFQALRRGGFSLNDIPNFPTGVFSVVLTARPTDAANLAAFEGVVASLSHYELGAEAAWGLLGDPDNGSTAGAITNFSKGTFSRSEAIFFNPNDVPVSVTLTGSYLRSTLPQFRRTFDVKPKGQVVLTDADFGLIKAQPVGLRYTSSLPISVNAANYQQGDADSSTGATAAGTRFLFGDAYMDPFLAGSKFFEYLYLYNPTASGSSVAIKLNFTDGTSNTFNVAVDARGFAEVRLHERPELTRRSGPTWFGIDASSITPFVMTMTHYDLLLGGGWATTGTPMGFVNPVSRIP